jgi:molybdopterin/thiamine biosynthesis adenylyltransferase
MRYSMTFCEEDYAKLTGHLFSDARTEQAAYLLCRPVRATEESRLLVREVILAEEADVTEASSVNMSILPRSFLRAMKRADNGKECLVFAHSHVNGRLYHSEQDDEEEAKLFRTAYIRIHNSGLHGSVVFSSPNNPVGRVWLPDGTTVRMDRIRVIGNLFHFYFHDKSNTEIPVFFDRQVRAFGKDIQRLLGRLHIGIVGVGGTGSSVAEQLIRMGAGSLTISDDDIFEHSNVNRVYGSGVEDDGTLKVKLAERLAASIGVGTRIKRIPRPITYRSVMEQFRECHLIFGCTDDEWGRSLLSKFAIYYQIPVFDMGVKINSEGGLIRSIQGRVTTLLPSAPCLFCRGRIRADRVREDSISATDPHGADGRRKEGYAPELEDPAPAVIPFTTAIASNGIIELIQHLTGFMGTERESSELLYLFDQSRIRTNSRISDAECFCGNRMYWGRGDTEPLLDLTWRDE